MSYSDMVIEDSWEPTPWPPAVSCSMTDLRWVIYASIGTAVVIVALGFWAMKRIIRVS